METISDVSKRQEREVFEKANQIYLGLQNQFQQIQAKHPINNKTGFPDQIAPGDTSQLKKGVQELVQSLREYKKVSGKDHVYSTFFELVTGVVDYLVFSGSVGDADFVKETQKAKSELVKLEEKNKTQILTPDEEIMFASLKVKVQGNRNIGNVFLRIKEEDLV